MKVFYTAGYWNVIDRKSGLLVARDRDMVNVLDSIRSHWSGKP